MKTTFNTRYADNRFPAHDSLGNTPGLVLKISPQTLAMTKSS